MTKPANDRSEINQTTIDFADLEVATRDGNQIKGGPHIRFFDGKAYMLGPVGTEEAVAVVGSIYQRTRSN